MHCTCKPDGCGFESRPVFFLKHFLLRMYTIYIYFAMHFIFILHLRTCIHVQCTPLHCMYILVPVCTCILSVSISAVPPDPCATVRCEPGYRCEVYQASSGPTAYCQPDCEELNPCRSGEVCEVEDVFCIAQPCPGRLFCRGTTCVAHP